MSTWTPSIVPRDDDPTVYLVLDELGRHGLAWRESRSGDDRSGNNHHRLLECQYSNPVRVVGFNNTEGWSRDVSEDIALELRRRSDLQLTELPACLREFVDQHERDSHDRAKLRLV